MSQQDVLKTDDTLMEELSALRQENHNLHGVNAALRQQLAVAHLETESVSRREQYLTGQIEQAQAQVRSLYASLSWRVTKPLRWARRRYCSLMGKIRPTAIPTAPPHAEPDVTSRMKPAGRENLRDTLGVFVHLYYDDLAPELARYILRVRHPKRIYLSTDTEEKAARIRKAFAATATEQPVDIRVFPNRGFDIAPFLVGFAPEIQRHALVLRLHGKKSSHLGETAGTVWRQMLLDSLLGDEKRIDAILTAFKRIPDLGMVCPEHWDGLYRLYDAPIAIGSNLARMAELLARYDVPLAAGTPIDFPSGSMFWCRPQALAPWLRFGLSWESFEESRDEARDASLAHALERSFLFGCGLEGLTWARANRLPATSGAPEPTR